jgi:hypothetical protein
VFNGSPGKRLLSAKDKESWPTLRLVPFVNASEGTDCGVAMKVKFVAEDSFKAFAESNEADWAMGIVRAVSL